MILQNKIIFECCLEDLQEEINMFLHGMDASMVVDINFLKKEDFVCSQIIYLEEGRSNNNEKEERGKKM